MPNTVQFGLHVAPQVRASKTEEHNLLSYSLPGQSSYTVSVPQEDRKRKPSIIVRTRDPDVLRGLPFKRSNSLVGGTIGVLEAYLHHARAIIARGFSVDSRKFEVLEAALAKLHALEGRERALIPGNHDAQQILQREVLVILGDLEKANAFLSLSIDQGPGKLHEITHEAMRFATKFEFSPTHEITHEDQKNFGPLTRTDKIDNERLAEIINALLPPNTPATADLYAEAIRRVNDFFTHEVPCMNFAHLSPAQEETLREFLQSLHHYNLVQEGAIDFEHLSAARAHNAEQAVKVKTAMAALTQPDNAGAIQAEHEILQAIYRIKNSYLRQLLLEEMPRNQLAGQLNTLGQIADLFDVKAWQKKDEVMPADSREFNGLEKLLTTVGIDSTQLEKIHQAHATRPEFTYRSSLETENSDEALNAIATTVSTNLGLEQRKFQDHKPTNYTRGRHFLSRVPGLGRYLEPRGDGHGVSITAGTTELASSTRVGSDTYQHGTQTATSGTPTADDLLSVSTIYSQLPLRQRIRHGLARFGMGVRHLVTSTARELFSPAVWRERVADMGRSVTQGHINSIHLRKALAAVKISYTPEQADQLSAGLKKLVWNTASIPKENGEDDATYQARIQKFFQTGLQQLLDHTLGDGTAQKLTDFSTVSQKTFAEFEKDTREAIQLRDARDAFRAKFEAKLRETNSQDGKPWLQPGETLEELARRIYSSAAEASAVKPTDSKTPAIPQVLASSIHTPYEPDKDSIILEAMGVPNTFFGAFRDYMEHNEITGAAALMAYALGAGPVLAPHLMIYVAKKLGIAGFSKFIAATQTLAHDLAGGHMSGMIAAGFTYYKGPVALNSLDDIVGKFMEALPEYGPQMILAAGLLAGSTFGLAHVGALASEYGSFKYYGAGLVALKGTAVVADVITNPQENYFVKIVKLPFQALRFVAWDLILAPIVESIKYGTPKQAYAKMGARLVDAVKGIGNLIDRAASRLVKMDLIDLALAVPGIVGRGLMQLPVLVLGTAAKIVNKLGGNAYLDALKNFKSLSVGRKIAVVLTAPLALPWMALGKALEYTAKGILHAKFAAMRFFGEVKRATMSQLTKRETVFNLAAGVPLLIGNLLMTPFKLCHRIATDKNASPAARAAANVGRVIFAIPAAIGFVVNKMGEGIQRVGLVVKSVLKGIGSFFARKLSRKPTEPAKETELETRKDALLERHNAPPTVHHKPEAVQVAADVAAPTNADNQAATPHAHSPAVAPSEPVTPATPSEPLLAHAQPAAQQTPPVAVLPKVEPTEQHHNPLLTKAQEQAAERAKQLAEARAAAKEKGARHIDDLEEHLDHRHRDHQATDRASGIALASVVSHEHGHGGLFSTPITVAKVADTPAADDKSSRNSMRG